MRTLIIFAMAAPLAVGLTAAPEQNTARGTVTGVRATRGNDPGEYLFTVLGRSPCGAVHFEYGDGQYMTHPTETLPVTISYRYTRTGDFPVRVQGMANCEGSAVTNVRVTSVQAQATPAPNVEPGQGRGRGRGRGRGQQDMAMRFVGMDANRDGVVTRTEWRGSQRSFEVHDWNSDNQLSGDEVRVGAAFPDRGADQNNWTMERFRTMDRNQDGRLVRTEWPYDVEDFLRVDRNADNQLELSEFLVGEVDDDRGDRFADLDLNNDNRLDPDEWHGSVAAFEWLDRNNNGTLSRTEVAGNAAVLEEDTPATGVRESPRRVVVSARQRWMDTGIDVRAGDWISVTAAGRILFTPNRNDEAAPGGAQGRAATPAAPMPSVDIGTLLGRIGSGDAFVVGDNLESLRASRAGRLYLTVNDDVLQDNSGEFQVSVVVTRR